MPVKATVTNIRSIQGERQTETQLTLWADDADVAEYLATVSAEVLACRERARHLFQSVSQAGKQVFSEIDAEGLMVRRDECQCCKLAVRVQRWGYLGRGRHTRFDLVSSSVVYKTGPKGERYTGKSGRGRMKPRQISRIQVEALFDDMTPAQIKQMVLAQVSTDK